MRPSDEEIIRLAEALAGSDSPESMKEALGESLTAEMAQELTTILDDRYNWIRNHHYGHFSTYVNELNAQLSRLREASGPHNYNDTYFIDLLRNSSLLSLPGSIRFETIAANQSSFGPEVAIIADGFESGLYNLSQVTKPEQLMAIIAYSRPDITSGEQYAAQLKSERASLRQALTRFENKSRRSLSERMEEWEVSQTETLERIRTLASEGVKRAAKMRKRWTAQVNAHCRSIAETERRFNEYMGLEAPVDYWNRVMREHKIRSDNFRKMLQWYFRIGPFIVLAVAGLAIILILLVPSSENSVPLYFVVSASVATITTFVFWVGRIISKRYLSEVHLCQDADERATMTKVYLALMASNADVDNERAIILSALFRNTSSGIVKDDTGVDASDLLAVLAAARHSGSR